MAGSRSLLEFIMRATKQGTAVQDMQRDLEDMEDATSSTDRQAQFFEGTMSDVERAVIDAGKAFLRAVPELLNMAVGFDRAEVALTAYSGSSEAAAQAVRLMGEATGGTIDKLTLMETATKMLAMGLADNGAEAAKLTQIAITLGSTMGKGPKKAIEEFTLMLANQSILRLDTFGISGATVRDRMQELADEGIDVADRSARFLTATLEEAAQKMGDLEDAGYEATSSLDRIAAMSQDVKQEMANWLADGLMPIVDGFFALQDAMAEHHDLVLRGTDTYEDYINTLSPLVRNTMSLSLAQWELFKATESNLHIFQPWIIEMQNASLAADDAAGSAGELEQATNRLKISIIGLTEADMARVALQNLQKAFQSEIITEEQYVDGMRIVLGQMMDLPEKEVMASIAVARLGLSFQNELIPLDDYFQGLENIYETLNAFPTDIHTTFHFSTHGNIPQLTTTGGYSVYQHGGEFEVRGPRGPDRVPVQFLASAGERVTITPQGQGAGGGGEGPITVNVWLEEELIQSSVMRGTRDQGLVF